MLSHQPDVSRLLHQEHVQRLAGDAQRPIRALRVSAPDRSRVLPRLIASAHAVLYVRHRRLPTRT
jgi:hypothetical protein